MPPVRSTTLVSIQREGDALKSRLNIAGSLLEDSAELHETRHDRLFLRKIPPHLGDEDDKNCDYQKREHSIHHDPPIG